MDGLARPPANHLRLSRDRTMSFAYAPLQPLDGTSTAALRENRDSTMLFGAFAASHAGLATDVHTDWTLGEEASENACGASMLLRVAELTVLLLIFID